MCFPCATRVKSRATDIAEDATAEDVRDDYSAVSAK